MNKDNRDGYIQGIKDEYAKAREAHANKKATSVL
jgi:5-methyltetrahydrofolate--homocysteine methyltransferase